MELQLKIIGCLLICLGLVHVIFPKYFDWKNDLSSISLINRQMMYVHTFFIAVMVLLMGILCATSAKELVETPLGNKLSFGIGVFWLLRLIVQFFGYSSDHWKGKKAETIIHILLSALWIYLTIVFLYIYCCNKCY